VESSLHVISRKKLLEAVARYADLAVPLDSWYRIAKAARWSNLTDLRRHFPAADGVGKYTVFNIKGNAYRLIAEIFYESQVILIRAVLTHAEYDKEGWKK
jgi:mRNA interferase HigB